MNRGFGATYREPRQERGRERFRTLLVATVELLEADPDRELAIQDVASAAGVTTGAVYHFFPNIQAIYAALIIEYNAELANLYLSARALRDLGKLGRRATQSHRSHGGVPSTGGRRRWHSSVAAD